MSQSQKPDGMTDKENKKRIPWPSYITYNTTQKKIKTTCYFDGVYNTSIQPMTFEINNEKVRWFLSTRNFVGSFCVFRFYYGFCSYGNYFCVWHSFVEGKLLRTKASHSLTPRLNISFCISYFIFFFWRTDIGLSGQNKLKWFGQWQSSFWRRQLAIGHYLLSEK